MHGSENVLFGRLAHGVLLIVGKNHHILAFIAKVFGEVGSHVANIVDAAAQLSALVEVVDSDEKGFSPASAVRVSEVVAIGSAMTELLRGCRRGGRATGSGIEVWLRRSLLVVTILRLGRRLPLVELLLLWRRMLLVAVWRLRRRLALRIATTVIRLRWVIIALRLLVVLGLRLTTVTVRIVAWISRHDGVVLAVEEVGGVKDSRFQDYELEDVED